MLPRRYLSSTIPSLLPSTISRLYVHLPRISRHRSAVLPPRTFVAHTSRLYSIHLSSMSSSPAPLLPDSLHISQLNVRLPLGSDAWERCPSLQPITLDIQVHTDVSKAGQSDHLPYSIHYGILVKEVEKHCQEAAVAATTSKPRYRDLDDLAVSRSSRAYAAQAAELTSSSLLCRTASPRSVSSTAKLPRSAFECRSLDLYFMPSGLAMK